MAKTRARAQRPILGAQERLAVGGMTKRNMGMGGVKGKSAVRRKNGLKARWVADPDDDDDEETYFFARRSAAGFAAGHRACC